MEMYEIRAAIKYEYYAHKDSWEQARFIAYPIYQYGTKQKLNMNELLPFYWEGDVEKPNTGITKEEIERLQRKAQTYLKNNSKWLIM